MADAAGGEEAEAAALREQIALMETYITQLQSGEGTLPFLLGTVLTDLVDELIVEVAFEVHRLVRLKMLCLCDPPTTDSTHR